MKIIVSHPSGNANVRAAAVACAQAGILSKFYTSIAVFKGTVLDKLSGFGPLAELNRRRFDTTLHQSTGVWPLRELGRLLSIKFGFKQLIKHEVGVFSVDAVWNNFDKRVAGVLKQEQKAGLNAVYAYEDGALNSFVVAKDLNLICIYDLPIGYWKAAKILLTAEQERWPEWASTLTGLRNSDEKLKRKDEELRLADQIFVASSFTAKTLNEYEGKLCPVTVIPYGFPPVVSDRKYNDDAKKPLKLLFVGGLSQRKGIADLFAAVDHIGERVALTVVGKKTIGDCPALEEALGRHKWIPSLPHHEVLSLMQEHDILVFPSLFEGFGLVITEAMSQGTPVITTDRTAGPDLITDGENGWIIEAGSTAALQQAIENLIGKPEVIAAAGRAAMETARLRPWEKYGQELSDAIVKFKTDQGGAS